MNRREREANKHKLAVAKNKFIQKKESKNFLNFMSKLKGYLTQYMTKMRKKEVSIRKKKKAKPITPLSVSTNWKEVSSLLVQILNQKPFVPLMGIKTFICSSMYTCTRAKEYGVCGTY